MSRSSEPISSGNEGQLLPPANNSPRDYDLEGEVMVLFEQLGGIVARTCRSRVGREAAEQASRACWVEILRLWPTYRAGSDRLDEWLSGVVHGICTRFVSGSSVRGPSAAGGVPTEFGPDTAAGFRRVSRVRVRAVERLLDTAES